MSKAEVEKLSKNFLFASLQSSSGIMAEQLDAAMANNTELEKYIYILERDNIRMVSLLRGYGYEETAAQRDLLLADYTPASQMKMKRQLEIMMLLSGLTEEQLEAADDYIDGKMNRSGLENKLKKFIISKTTILNSNDSHVSVPDSPVRGSPVDNDDDHPSECAGNTELSGPSEGVIDGAATPKHYCIQQHPHTNACTMTVANSRDDPSLTNTDIRLIEKPTPVMATKL